VWSELVGLGGRDMFLPQSRRIVERHSVYNLARPGFWQKAIHTCTILINASMYILVARALQPQAFGTYLFVQWLAGIAVPAIGAGTAMLASRQIAEVQSREAPRQVAGIFYFFWYRQHRRILFYSLIYLLLALPLSQMFPWCTPVLLLLAGLSTLPLLLSNVAGTTLRGLRRADLLTMLNLFGALLTLLLVIIATQVAGEPVEAFLLASALANTLTLILAVVCVIRLLPLDKALQPGIFLKERLTSSLKHSWLLFALDAIIWQRGELVLLAYWSGQANVGYYALASMISTVLIGLAPQLFSSWVLPLVLRYVPGHHYSDAYDAFVKTSCYIVLLAVPICMILIILCPVLITFCMGTMYLPLIQPLRILLIASVFGSIATVSLTHLAHVKQKGLQTWLNAGVACSKVVLALPLVLFWGTSGAATVSALAQIASSLIAILMCRHILKRREAVSAKGRS